MRLLAAVREVEVLDLDHDVERSSQYGVKDDERPTKHWSGLTLRIDSPRLSIAVVHGRASARASSSSTADEETDLEH